MGVYCTGWLTWPECITRIIIITKGWQPVPIEEQDTQMGDPYSALETPFVIGTPDRPFVAVLETNTEYRYRHEV